MSFFDRIKVNALNVLDDREFQDLTIINFSDNGRQCVNASLLGSAPAALSCNDLILFRFSRKRAKQNWLQNTVFTYRSSEFFELFIPKGLARLIRIAEDEVYWNIVRVARCNVGRSIGVDGPSSRVVAKECGEASSKRFSI